MEHLLEEPKLVIIREVLLTKNILFSINLIKEHCPMKRIRKAANLINFILINQK